VILPDFARAFVKAGYAAFVFDYRGFGESEGQKNRLISKERDEDIINATTFLGLQPEIDATRIALFGISYGGANVISTGAADLRTKAIVSVVGFGDAIEEGGRGGSDCVEHGESWSCGGVGGEVAWSEGADFFA